MQTSRILRQAAAGMVLVLACFLLPAGALAQAEVKSGFVDVKHGRLFYEEAGVGPVVVLIHGGNLDRRMWDEQFLLFAREFWVIRYDVRGFGKSTQLTHAYSDTDDLASLLDHLRITKAHLVGLSMGGRIAIDFALVHPDKVLSLVLAGPGVSGFNFDASAMAQFWEVVRVAQEKGPEAASETWLKNPYMAPAMGNPVLAARIREISHENRHVFLSNPLLGHRLSPPAMHRLGELRAPILLVVGDRDVNDILAICGILEVRAPQAKKIVIREAGHMVNMEKPAEFDQAVLTFLRARAKE